MISKITSLLFWFVLFSILSCKSGNEINISVTREYYVDHLNGSDSNPGTNDKPLKTIDQLNKLMQKVPGHVFLAGGQVLDGTLILKNINGPDSTPVKINSHGEGRAVINGKNAEAIIVDSCKNIWITGIDLKGSGRKDGNTKNGLSMVRSERCLIEYLNAEGFQKSGVELNDCKAIVVKKVNAINNGFCGINVTGSQRKNSGNIMIQDCNAVNNAGDPSILDNHSGNGILVGVSEGVTIDHCTATNNGWDMPREGNGPVGIWAWESDNVTIQYCISYRNKTSKNAKDGGGFDFDGGVTNSVIQYCLSYENQGAGYGLFQYWGASPWANNTVRYCVSINDGQTTEGSGSFFIWNGSEDANQLAGCRIYNNVAVNSKAPVISYEKASRHKDFIFSNNIFLGDNPLSGNIAGSSFIGNVWWNSESGNEFTPGVSFIEWAKNNNQEIMDGHIVGSFQDPKLKGPLLTGITDPYQLDNLEGYTLQEGSPLKNKGYNLRSLLNITQPTRDFYGNPVPLGQGPEAGIYEMK